VVDLAGVAPNCAVTPPAQSASIRIGGLTRDTARVRFDVACVRTEKIAFVQGDFVIVAYADGSNSTSVATGIAPTWSPAGDFLAFESIRCAAGYSGEPPPPDRCTRLGLAVVRANGSDLRMLSTISIDRNPAWSPDGRYIALDNGVAIELIDMQTGTRAQLSLPPLAEAQPVWSPDGQRIAFSCQVAAGNNDICVVNRDGSGFVRLTSDASHDTDPAWSPDGSLIAFNTNRFSGRDDIAVMTATGTDARWVAGGNAPAWSKDGRKILFAITGLGLGSVNSDGSGFTVLTRQGEYAPVWRW
jgi:Tol biopolymer transport system component